MPINQTMKPDQSGPAQPGLVNSTQWRENKLYGNFAESEKWSGEWPVWCRREYHTVHSCDSLESDVFHSIIAPEGSRNSYENHGLQEQWFGLSEAPGLSQLE